jgi:hypothetical protein
VSAAKFEAVAPPAVISEGQFDAAKDAEGENSLRRPSRFSFAVCPKAYQKKAQMV